MTRIHSRLGASPGTVTRLPLLGLALALGLLVAALVSPGGTSPSTADVGARADVRGVFNERVPTDVGARRARRGAEVGLRVRSSRNGWVTSVQYLKTSPRPGNTPRSASVWTDAGQLLARVRVNRTRDVGWLTVPLPTPVRMRQGDHYRVSVFHDRGTLPVSRGGFPARVRRDGLVARARDNAVIRRTTRTRFPARSSARADNYWVDLDFVPGAATPTPTTTPTTKPTSTGRPTGTPTVTPTGTPTGTPTATPTATPTPAPGNGVFPTPENTGVPAGWTPVRTVNGTLTVSTPGAVVEDVRVLGGIVVAAADVTLRRVDVVGGGIDNVAGRTCHDGLLVEDSTIRRNPDRPTAGATPAFGTGGYVARRVEIDGLPEGFRVGGRSAGCGAVVIESSYARVVRPDECGDWHGDGIQGYDGAALTVRTSTLVLVENGCGGTAPFFYPDQGNTSVDIDGLLVEGGGYPFRLGTPGTVNDLAIVDGSWGYGPISVRCSLVSFWRAHIVTVDSQGTTTKVREQKCNTSS